VEIDSPPFPKTSTNPTQMFWALSELFDWAMTGSTAVRHEHAHLSVLDPTGRPRILTLDPN